MSDRHVRLTLWEGPFDWHEREPVTYADAHADAHADPAPAVDYSARVWQSPVVETEFPATELIPSWNAATPPGSWLLVEGRVGSPSLDRVEGLELEWSRWFVFARWCDGDPDDGAPIIRTSEQQQADQHGAVNTDTLLASSTRPFTHWQLRLTALATSASPSEDEFPEVTVAAGCVSAIRIEPGEPTSPRPSDGERIPREVEVPPLSQRLHVDTFPQWDNGGASWCSPTCTTMLLRHWGAAPSADETAWVGHAIDPDVVHATRHVYDATYQGSGNWSFNTAYAATRGLRAYVTRLRDLREAEQFVASGIPLVVSVSFSANQLEGAGYDTSGHLLTIVGFTADGDVVSNDPNSHRVASNERVRTVYRRDQFERVWLRGDGGMAYVMHPRHVPLPTPPDEANWA